MTDQIYTHSLLKTFRRCPRESLYKHIDLITPRRKESNPLERGTWFHALLEAYYSGNSVKDVHKNLCAQYEKLYDEEKEKLGDLPREMVALFNSYKWHYRSDESWTVHEVELKVEAELPNGMQYQGKIDMLIEDQFGLWIVDHKTMKSLPDVYFRLRDTQSILYIWALRACGIPVEGFIWNYCVPVAPQPLKFNQNGSLSKRQPLTDYPTALKGLVKLGLSDEPEYQNILADLEKRQYDPDMPQASPVFRRDTLDKSDDIVERSLKEAMHTAERFEAYDFENRDAVERVNDRSCSWCSYRFICIAELIGRNADNVRRQMYKAGDPLAYYQNEKDK